MPFNGKYSSSAISCSPRPRHHVPDYYQSRMEHRPAGVSACNVPFRIISDSNDDDNNKCQRSEIGIGAIKANERTESIGVKESAILVQPSFRLPILHLCWLSKACIPHAERGCVSRTHFRRSGEISEERTICHTLRIKPCNVQHCKVFCGCKASCGLDFSERFVISTGRKRRYSECGGSGRYVTASTHPETRPG